MNVVNEVGNNKGKCKIDHELQITFCHSFKSGEASLYTLMLSVAFSLLLQSETMNRSLQSIESIVSIKMKCYSIYFWDEF
ncbi:hypothetical protein T03_1168 [Trichinella britovi]|uniref:Uncharacterized protein n=1 Tax=Trichinella britovi TaxID=45882 RepID=A0A0V1D9T6_TRIBR|nr:hypothetical protein T03_4548 [Trichinella britovi]KRY58261.1 hypothetical protein T03_4924 [Trichinella britovi]KRY58263.1 hypothetical protein T03_1168 [Trichinella britovi]